MFVRVKGQTITEFLIIMPIFFLVLFGIFEFTYIYRAKMTLNTATFEAARAGAINHGRVSEMRSALAKGMLPLFVKGKKDKGNLVLAYGKVKAMEMAVNKTFSTVKIVHPTTEIYNKFKVKRLIRFNHQSKPKTQWFMPNDHLATRSTVKEQVKVKGKNQKISIQDANLLKIKTHWCYELKVPALKQLMTCFLLGTVGGCNPFGGAPNAEQVSCEAVGGVLNGDYIALSSHAVVRMQSAFVQ